MFLLLLRGDDLTKGNHIKRTGLEASRWLDRAEWICSTVFSPELLWFPPFYCWSGLQTVQCWASREVNRLSCRELTFQILWKEPECDLAGHRMTAQEQEIHGGFNSDHSEKRNWAHWVDKTGCCNVGCLSQVRHIYSLEGRQGLIILLFFFEYFLKNSIFLLSCQESISTGRVVTMQSYQQATCSVHCDCCVLISPQLRFIDLLHSNTMMIKGKEGSWMAGSGWISPTLRTQTAVCLIISNSIDQNLW